MIDRIRSFILDRLDETPLGNFFYQVYLFAHFWWDSTRKLFYGKRYRRIIWEQMEFIGVKSLGLVFLTSTFTGLVMAFQTGFQMERFGAKNYIGTIVALAVIRELGPVLTSLVVAGRVGAGIAAELGSMAVSEQINAMRSMAVDPIRKLVNTRFFAASIMLPALVVVADVLGIFGGWIVSTTSLGLDTHQYIFSVRNALRFGDLVTGLIKPLVFGQIIAMISCYIGINTTGGTKGVGTSTTLAVVVSSVLIFVSDFILTKVFFIIKL